MDFFRRNDLSAGIIGVVEKNKLRFPEIYYRFVNDSIIFIGLSEEKRKEERKDRNKREKRKRGNKLN